MVFKMVIRMVVGGGEIINDKLSQDQQDEYDSTGYLSNSQSSSSLCEQQSGSSSLYRDEDVNGGGEDELEFVVSSSSPLLSDGTSFETTHKRRYRIRLDNAIRSIMEARHEWLNFRRNPRAFLLFFTTMLSLITIINRNMNYQGQTCSLQEDYHPHSSLNNTVPPIYFFDDHTNPRIVYENWEKTKKWRVDNKISTILSRPPPYHELIRYQLLPTAFYNEDKEGNTIVIEKWGSADVDGIKSRGIKHDDVIQSYMFDTEYLWTHVSPLDTDKITLIMDVGNVTFQRFTSWESMKLIRERIQIGCLHYPNRAAHLLMINVPDFISNIYRLAEPLLSESTKSKISFLSEHDVKVKKKLLKIIDEDKLLQEYGGSSKIPFGHATHDMNLRKHVQSGGSTSIIKPKRTGSKAKSSSSSTNNSWKWSSSSSSSTKRSMSSTSSRSSNWSWSSTSKNRQEEADSSEQEQDNDDQDEFDEILKQVTITQQDIIDNFDIYM